MLVTGTEALVSRDVVRLLVAEGASVTAAGCDEAALARLQRDLGLYRTTVNIAAIDLFSPSEMRLFTENMQTLGRLPHIVACCCDGAACPVALAASLLQPSLVLHALPSPGAGLRRAVARMSIPTLADLLHQGRRRGIFDPRATPRRVSIAGHLFALRRGEGSREMNSARRPHLPADRAPTAAGRTLLQPNPGGGTAASPHSAPWRRNTRNRP